MTPRIHLLPLLFCTACTASQELPVIDLASCDEQTYRITSVQVPFNATSAIEASIDIDQDELTDNAAGGLIGSLVSTAGETGLEDRVNAGLASNEAPWFLILHRCPEDEALLRLLRGRDSDGDGRFEIEDRELPPARGEIVDGRVQTFGGSGDLPAGIFSDPLGVADQVWTTWTGSASDLQIEGDVLEGRMGMALSPGYFETVASPLAAYFTYHIEQGDSVFGLEMDRNADGIVSITELAETSIFAATLLNPDLDMLGRDGRYRLQGDGVPESLSFSLQIHAEATDALF